MRNKIIKNIELKQQQKTTVSSTLITHQKSNSNFDQNMKKNDVKEKQKPMNRLSRNKQLSSSLIASRSNPALLTPNNYIKLEQVDPKDLQQVFSRFNSTNSKLQKLRSMEDIMETKKKPSLILERQTVDGVFKKPKFIRRNNDSKQIQIFSPIGNSSANLNDSVKSFGDLIQQNALLRNRVKDLQQKIQELGNKPKTLTSQNYVEKLKLLENSLKQCENKINKKNQQIKQLQQRVSICEEQKRQLAKKLQELMNEQQLFQRDSCSLNLDDSGIGGDMMSTAEYIQSLTDLQDQLHQRKTQIFDLNKAIDQLQMKHHFAQLRNQETLQRVHQEWETKYKRLMQMYKTLKTTRTDSNNKMKKLKTKTQYIDCERQSLFNLSMSTDRSQLPF